jgi:exopolyphosphatase/pppGpp-phosphohydrolase
VVTRGTPTNPDSGERPDHLLESRPDEPIVAAAVDIGSNSVHLVVAVAAGHGLEPLVDESVFLGLGAAVDATDELGPEKRSELTAVLTRYADMARDLGAVAITFVGTEPLRRATDAAAAIAAVKSASGVEVRVLSHEEEGLLTLLGVTRGHRPERDIAVVDIGGGSSEFVIVGPDRPAVAYGVRIGSARLTAACVEHDPPSEPDIARLRAAARELLAEAPDERIADLVAVGGTATNLVKVVPAAALDRTLDRRRLQAALDVLAVEPADLAARRHAVNPIRARILPAGAAIVEAILDRYGLERITVSEAGIREGAVLASVRGGPGWHASLDALVHGHRASG